LDLRVSLQGLYPAGPLNQASGFSTLPPIEERSLFDWSPYYQALEGLMREVGPLYQEEKRWSRYHRNFLSPAIRST